MSPVLAAALATLIGALATALAARRLSPRRGQAAAATLAVVAAGFWQNAAGVGLVGGGLPAILILAAAAAAFLGLHAAARRQAG